jgi:hypothetical protein
MSDQDNAQDDTAAIRRVLVEQQQRNIRGRATLEAQCGQVYDTDEFKRAFVLHGFAAPFVMVTEIKTGRRGSLEFQHMPRFYYNFVPDE